MPDRLMNRDSRISYPPWRSCSTHGRARIVPCSRPSRPSRLRPSPCASSRAFRPPNTRRATSVSSCPWCLQPHRLALLAHRAWHVLLSDLRPSSSSASPEKQKHLNRRRRRPRPRPDRLGQQLGLLPRTQSQGRGSSHAPARADILFGISRGSRMIRRLRRRACVRRRRPAASSGTTWTNRLVLRPRCKYAQRRRY